MRFTLLLLLCITSINSYSQSQKDSIAIVKLLKDDYTTMNKNTDFSKHKSNCTLDYLLIEDGEIATLKMEAEMYKQMAKRNLIREDNFDFKKVKISGDFAYAVWYLKTNYKSDSTSFNMEWNESAVFQKINREWKISLIHSTPIEKNK